MKPMQISWWIAQCEVSILPEHDICGVSFRLSIYTYVLPIVLL